MPAASPSEDSPKETSHRKYRVPRTKDLLRLKAEPNLGQRDRSVPYKGPFIIAILSMLVFYLSMIGLLAAIIAFFLTNKEQGAQHRVALIIAALVAFSAITWVYAYLMRRKATCPLCKCTPLLDNLALKHQKAHKVWPLNYGNTAILSVVLNQRWRCMYCGTPFDIIKNKLKDNG